MKAKSPIIKIAYAEDHIAMRDAMVGYLQKDKFIKVILVGDNGQQLLDKLILSDEMPDVCLIDIQMPLLNGFGLLNEIKKRWPKLPCLILSGLIDEYYIINMIKAGASGYLLKTCTGPELINAVRRVYSDGYYYNDILNERIIENIADLSNKHYFLNEREKLFLSLICCDLSYADIAQQWGTTYRTVDGIRERLMVKLRINSRVGLVIAAIRLGFFVIESEKFAQTEKKVIQKITNNNSNS